MGESRKIRFFEVDDWVWVYADDRCVFSGHSIKGPQLLEALNYEDFSTHWMKDDVAEEEFWSIGGDEPLSDFPTHLFED